MSTMPTSSEEADRDGDGFFVAEEGCFDVAKAYDPLYLRHLRNPRPRDHPPGLPRDFFTFEDAFEDLMNVQFNGELMPMPMLAGTRLKLRLAWPLGEPFDRQIYRFAQRGDLYMRRRNAMVRGNLGLVISKNQRGVYRLEGWDPHHEVLDMLDDPRPNIFPGFAKEALTDSKSPRTELDLAESIAKSSQNSLWASPFDTLWSMVGRKPAETQHDNLGYHLPSVGDFRSEHVQVIRTDEGISEQRIIKHRNAKGDWVYEILERKSDPQGNVISETRRKAHSDDDKKEAGDVYNGLS